MLYKLFLKGTFSFSATSLLSVVQFLHLMPNAFLIRVIREISVKKILKSVNIRANPCLKIIFLFVKICVDSWLIFIVPFASCFELLVVISLSVLVTARPP